MFGSKTLHSKLNVFYPNDKLGNRVSLAGVIRNLGVWLDSDFAMSGTSVRLALFCRRLSALDLSKFQCIQKSLAGIIANIKGTHISLLL